MRELVLLHLAEADILKAFLYYEDKQSNLGEEFIKHTDYALRVIRHHPEIAPLKIGKHRRWIIEKFPYGIFYTVYPGSIVISGVMDLRQNPNKIKRRLEKE